MEIIEPLISRMSFDFPGEVAGIHKLLDVFSSTDLGPDHFTDRGMAIFFLGLIDLLFEKHRYSTVEHTTSGLSALVSSLLVEADLTPPHAERSVSVYDPAGGTGALLAAVEERLSAIRPHQEVTLFGQEPYLTALTVSRAWALLAGRNPSSFRAGSSLTDPRHRGTHFDYLVSSTFGHRPLQGQEAESVIQEAKQGANGRFPAGVPQGNAAPFLLLQHMVAHMRSPAEGGARMALVFSANHTITGDSGSPESKIRQWLLDEDLLEGVISLPPGLISYTKLSVHVWLLSNRKNRDTQGEIVFLDARDMPVTESRESENWRKVPTEQEVHAITDLYRVCLTAPEGRAANEHGRAHRVPSATCRYRTLVFDRPLRQRFTVTDSSIAAVERANPVQKYPPKGALIAALKRSIGVSWNTRAEFDRDLTKSLEKLNVLTPLPSAVLRSVINTVAITCDSGETQIDDTGSPRPDPALRITEKVLVETDVDSYLRDRIHPYFPDAWYDSAALKEGCDFPEELFRQGIRPREFSTLAQVARKITPKRLSQTDLKGFPLLDSTSLMTVSTSSELPEPTKTEASNKRWASCKDGDVVGLGRNWRLLPLGFGAARTQLEVLRPHRDGTGEALCEWLRHQDLNAPGTRGRPTLGLAVPAEIIRDPGFNESLGDLRKGQGALAKISQDMYPNVFNQTRRLPEDILAAARQASARARLITRLTEPLEDPIWRAEWGYPYPVATLARQVRVHHASLERRKDALLKLGESVARALGLMATAILNLSTRSGLPTELHGQFNKPGGASFGTWINLLRKLGESNQDMGTSLPGLSADPSPEGTLDLLEKIKDQRNTSGHAHGVSAQHELEEEISILQPLVVRLLDSVSWFSDLSWDQVERCEYTGVEHRLVGWRLRGAHPEWEPFEKSPSGLLHPDRVYVQHRSVSEPLSLWPFVTVEVCPICRQLELFLLNDLQKHDSGSSLLTLRSGKDHEIERIIPA
ncbi:hypothetical protein GCM10027590_57380 [Nocardiopsis nanhaiensis]